MKCAYHTVGVTHNTVKVAITPNKVWSTLHSVIYYTTFFTVWKHQRKISVSAGKV